MSRFSFLWCIVLIIILPLSIITLSGNVVLRISETYVYHFNDSQVIEDIGSIVYGSEVADEITGYFNSPSSEEFQIYEENGDYRDPIFDEVESRAMKRAKILMTWTLFFAVVLMGGSIALYIFMTTSVEREMLRLVGFIALIVSAIEMLLIDFLITRPDFRAMLFKRFIGVELGKESTLMILLGSPFEKTYIIFSTVLAIAIIGIFTYIHYSTTKEKRLFS